MQDLQEGIKWKKRFFLLRASGLYYSSKGESSASKHLVCYVKFDEHDMCRAIQFDLFYKAPTEFCFCFKVFVA
jgi:hypothetical protein